MTNYHFLSPGQIIFGWKRRSEIGIHVKSIGARAILVSGSRTLAQTGLIPEVEQQLRALRIDVISIQAPSREPEISDVDRLSNDLRAIGTSKEDVIVALGGGSTIDLAKASAVMVTNSTENSVLDFLEGVGCGRKITEPPINMIAVPTTAGTGAEATKNSVISSNDSARDELVGDTAKNPFKKSLRSDLMIPRIVLVDPELTVTVPPQTTAFTGMDAITQLIESYVSRRSAPIPQALCLQGLRLAIPALPIAVKDPTSQPAREAMSHAALLSGIALANSGLGLAHGVAAALGVTCRIPHGLACAVMLPTALHWNLPVCTRQFAELERIFDPDAGIDPVAANAFLDRIEGLCIDLKIPSRLRDLGVERKQIPALVSGSRGNSMSGNPRDVSDDRLAQILEQMW